MFVFWRRDVAGRLILVTGIPGTGVRDALQKYIDWHARIFRGTPLAPTSHSLEDDFLLPRLKGAQLIPGDADIFDALQLPKSLLRDAWTHAFNDLIDSVRPVLQDGRDVFCTFHAVYYYHANHEYISCVNFDLVFQLDVSIGPTITLIDDIYDVRERLSEPRGLFSYGSADIPALDDLEDLLRLQKILDWRHVETLVSERIASVAKPDFRHFIFATKHPTATFHDLLYSSKPIVYLAHPISEIRRLRRAGGDAQTMADEVSDEISRLTTDLRTNFTLLEPTTIDELRFSTVIANASIRTGEVRTISYPNAPLTERWQSNIPIADTMNSPPQQDPKLFRSETPPDSSEVEPAAAVQGALDISLDDQSSVNRAQLIKYLDEAIQNQIKSRDFALIEQADGLVAFRPVFRGHASDGVWNELQFHDRLVSINDGRATAVILHFPSDEKDYRRQTLKQRLEQWQKEGKVSGSGDDIASISDRDLDSCVVSVHGSPNDRQAAIALERLITAAGMSMVPPPTGTLGRETAQAARDLADDCGSVLRSILESHIVARRGNPKVTVIQEEMTATEFAELVKRELVMP
jgi:hypothetical protein